jgi:hypothetical protein
MGIVSMEHLRSQIGKYRHNEQVNPIQTQLETALRKMILNQVGGEAPEKLALSPTNEMLLKYLTWRRRQVPATPRNVEMAQDLLTSPQYTEHKDEINEIAEKIRSGRDLRGHLSRSALPIGIFDPPDPLLSDWGVHHLHLSLETHHKNTNLLARTKNLLWAIFTPDTAYLIGIYEHGDWVRETVLETVVREWGGAGIYPESRSGARMKDPISSDERKEFRKAGINVPFEVDEKLWMTAGMALSGVSLDDVEQTNRIMHAIPAVAAELRSIFPKSSRLVILPIRNTVSVYNPCTGKNETLLEI